MSVKFPGVLGAVMVRLDDETAVKVCYLELIKAFDSVYHQLLMNAIQYFATRAFVLN